jgi:hypothetical protein
MKQNQNMNMKQEYQKKPASQTKSTSLIKKPRATRLEQMNRTPEQIKEIYDHRSAQYKLRKLRKTKTPYLSDRKLIRFLISASVPYDKKKQASKVFNIYITPESNLAYGYQNAQMFSQVTDTEFSWHTNRRDYLKRTDRTNPRFFKTIPTNQKALLKKEQCMKQPIPDYLLAIKSFKPTEKGYVNLAIVPEVVVGLADKEMVWVKNQPTNPFTYFLAICRRKCNEMGLVYDQTLKKKLLQGRLFEESDPLFDSLFVPTKPSQTPKTGKAESSYKGFVPPGFREFAERKEQERLEKERKRNEQIEWDTLNPYLAAKRIEEALHDEQYQATVKSFWRHQAYNPWFTQLAGIEQRRLLGEVHADCRCDRSFLSKPSSITISLDQAKKDMIFV